MFESFKNHFSKFQEALFQIRSKSFFIFNFFHFQTFFPKKIFSRLSILKIDLK